MPAKYCVKSGCGAKTDYTTKVPTFCSSCGQPFSAAFVGAAPSVRVTSSIPITTVNAPVRTSRRPPSEDGQDDESEQYDKDEMYNRAQELAASLSTSDFFSVREVDDHRFSVADLLLDTKKQINIGVRGGVITDPSQLPSLSE